MPNLPRPAQSQLTNNEQRTTNNEQRTTNNEPDVTALRPPRLLLPALLLLAALPAAAQELYLWTDEDGVRHISDRRPDGAYDVDVQRGIARPDAPVEMRNVGSEREPEWRFLNRLYGPVSVQVAFSEA